MSKAAQHRAGAFNATQAEGLLREGLAEFPSDIREKINEGQIKQLIDYLALMAKWNPVYNLTAIRHTKEMVSAHLLDSIAIISHLKQWLGNKNNTRILDVGTGGGLPGVVLAILRPDWSLTLIDPVHKKTAFLQQVKSQLSLDNLTVVTGKVEDLSAKQSFDLITSRAFASISLFVQLSHAVLADDGCFAAMKGILPSEEINELQQAFAGQWQIETHEIHVPQLNAQRHLVKISRINATHIHPKGTS